MKLSLIHIIFIFLGNTSFAEDIKWYEGSVILKSNEVLTGAITVQLEYDLVLVKNGYRVDIYPAHKISTVSFFDESRRINRRFTSMQQENGNPRSYKLFEIILDGEISIVRRMPKMHETDGVTSYHYYVVNNHKVITLRKFRRSVFPKLLRSSESIAGYVKAENLKANHPVNFIRIIKFYNTTTL